MPRVARFRTAALASLHQDVQFAPRETKLRQLRAAEALIPDLEADAAYPADFVVYRITGYRSDRAAVDAVVPGADLIADAVTFVLRISYDIELRTDEFDRPWVPLSAVEAELQVSRKTLQRYRQHGLVVHALHDHAAASTTLVCARDALDAFIARHAERVADASRFSRVDATTEAKILDEARERAAAGETLVDVVTALAERHGRAPETMRAVIRRADRRLDEPIFGAPGPLTTRDGQVILRALRMGVTMERLRSAYRKTGSSIRRCANRERGRRLRRWAVSARELPTFTLPDAEAVILATPVVRRDLNRALPATLEALLRDLRERRPLDDDAAASLVAGMHWLRRRVTGATEALGPWPGSIEMDAIETDLRWATRLRRQLVIGALPATLPAIDQFLHQPLDALPAAEIVAHLEHAVGVASMVADALDPAAGQSLARRTDYAMDRALAERGVRERPTRARAARSRRVDVSTLLDGLDVWEADLELSPSHAAVRGALSAPLRDLIERHRGLQPTPPESIADLAESLGRPIAGVRRSIDAAYRQLVRDARAARSE